MLTTGARLADETELVDEPLTPIQTGDVLRVRQGLLAVAVLLLVGGALMALLPFDDGAVRCGGPLFGADPAVDGFSDGGPGETVVVGDCGDKGIRRLVYGTGLFVVGTTATMVIAVRWDRGSRGEGVPDPARTGE